MAVCQEQVHDLLVENYPVLKVREDLDHGVYVDGASEEGIPDSAAAARLLAKGERHRHVAATAMNHVSSRSHAVFTLKVVAVVPDREGYGTTKIITSKFNLVDLAGSERQQNTLAEGVRLKEASGINKSSSNNALGALVTEQQRESWLYFDLIQNFPMELRIDSTYPGSRLL